MSVAVKQFVEEARRGSAIVLDGGTGSMFEKHGITAKYPTLTRKGREVATLIAQEYIAAGARVLMTPTWRSKETDIAHSDARTRLSRSRSATLWGIDATLEGIEKSKTKNVLAMASVSNVGECYAHQDFPKQHLQDVHGRHADLLRQSGIKIVMLETFTGAGEAKIAADAVRNAGLQSAITWVVRDNKLLDGTPIGQAAKFLADSKPLILGANCSPMEETKTAVIALRASGFTGIIMAKPNGPEFRGEDVAVGGTAKFNASTSFAADAVDLVKHGADMVGGCCGTVTSHIKETAAAVEAHKKAPSVIAPARRTLVTALPFQKTGDETNIRVGLNPFRGACECHPAGALLAQKL